MLFLKNYILLPDEVTDFENNYLRKMNLITLRFFYVHLPVMMIVAWLADTGVVFAGLLTSFFLLGPMLAHRTFKTQRGLSMSHGFTSMCLGGLLVHFGQGPMQIEMHFYFFAVLAMLSLFGNPMVNITAAVTVAVHHLVLWLVLPSSVFNYDASVWVVGVHALFVVLETVAAVYLARSFFDNVIGLEKIVQARTEEVRQRSRDMRMILDNVNQGFLSVELDGTMSAEKSAILSTWLGDASGHSTLQAYAGATDEEFSTWFELGLESVADGFLPLEVSLDQLPKRMTAKDRTLRFDYTPILGPDGEAEKILVVISDITDLLERQKAERDQQEIVAAFEKIMSNKMGFLEFFEDAAQLVELICTDHDDRALLSRRLHTLKGNAGIFGLTSIADCCHSLEDVIAETGEPPTDHQLAELTDRWTSVRSRLKNFLGTRDTQRIEIEDHEYEEILAAVTNGAPSEEIEKMIRAWKMEPLERRLATLAEQAQGLAQRLGKPDIKVGTDASGVRLDSESWSSFWSAFVHVVRNAVDHGIEDAEERTQNGKTPAGELTLKTFVDDADFVIELADDGRGIDWSQIAEIANRLGLPSDDTQDLQKALFADGLSTKKVVTSISGRGVGMAAVREEVAQRSGNVSIDSTPGKGTVFQFKFPVNELDGKIAWKEGKARA